MGRIGSKKLRFLKDDDVADQPLISIVDDDEGIRSSLDGLMRSLGYCVAVFDSAEGFLASDAAARSECIVSDVQMPGGMSGIELLSQVRDAGKDVPIILISAFTGEDSRDEAIRAGAYCTLKKPFDGDDLVHCVERALRSDEDV
jgi:FixJ family two-component response regulator